MDVNGFTNTPPSPEETLAVFSSGEAHIKSVEQQGEALFPRWKFRNDRKRVFVS
jgi:hypothetical protein